MTSHPETNAEVREDADGDRAALQAGETGRVTSSPSANGPASIQQREPIQYPALYGAADAASGEGQRGYLAFARADLLLILAAAALSVTAAFIWGERPPWFAVITSIVIIGGLFIKSATRIRQFDYDWFDGRAVAESVKTATWRYMMRVRPFDVDDVAAEMRFLKDLREVLNARSGLWEKLGRVPANSQQVTPSIQLVRSLPFPSRKERYLLQRLVNQIDWYGGRSEANRVAGARWFWTSLVAQGVAATFAIVSIVWPKVGALVALLSAATVGATAWTQIARHDELSKSYGVAAQELMLLRSQIELADNEETFGQLVIEAESAISREHTMWMAKRG